MDPQTDDQTTTPADDTTPEVDAPETEAAEGAEEAPAAPAEDESSEPAAE